jgi:hypothetical protein
LSAVALFRRLLAAAAAVLPPPRLATDARASRKDGTVGDPGDAEDDNTSAAPPQSQRLFKDMRHIFLKRR